MDKKAANHLQDVTKQLVTCKDEQEMAKLQADYEQTLAVFKEKSPELAEKWPAAVGALKQEALVQQQVAYATEQAQALQPKVDALKASISDNDRQGLELESQRTLAPLIQSGPLKEVAEKLGLNTEQALDLGRSLLVANLKGDASELEQLKFQTAAGDAEAAKKQQFLGALTQALAEKVKPAPMSDDQIKIAIGQDPLLQGILNSPQCGDLTQQLQLTKEEVDSTVNSWAKSFLQGDNSELLQLDQAASSDPKSQSKIQFLNALVTTYQGELTKMQQVQSGQAAPQGPAQA